MPTGDYEDEAAFRKRMGLSPYQGISPYVPASDAPYEPLLDPAERASGLPFASRVTYYAPGPGDRMEGKFETSKPNPLTGEYKPSTLDDVRLGRSPFVTVASDPSRYGQKVDLGDLTYKSPIDGKTYTLPRVFGMVHDTGSAFRGRPDKLDVAAGDFRGWSPQQASAYVQQDAGRRMVTPMAGGYSPEDNGMARKLPFAFPDPSTSRIPPEWLAGADPGDPGGGAYFNPNNPVAADFSALAQPSPSEVPPWLAAAAQSAVGGGGDAGGATDVSGQSRMPPGAVAAPRPSPGPSPGPPTGNLPFGIPGTAFNNPVQQALGDNFATLLAFAGGARQGGIGQGLSQAAKAAVIEGPQQEQRRLQQQAQVGIYQALRQKGMGHAEAMSVAVAPPEVFKAMAPEVFGTQWEFKTVKNANGDEVGMWVNKRTQETKPVGGVAGAPLVPNAYLAPGVTKVDESLPANEFLSQYTPSFQAAVKSYASGESMPTGNPRKGFTQDVKNAAKLWGEKQGMVVSDAAFAEKRKLRDQLGSASPASMGGQLDLANTSLGHLGDTAEAYAKLNNKDVLGGYLPGVSHAVNLARGKLTTEQSNLVKSVATFADRYGKESTKLYAGSPGAARERIDTAARFSTGDLTPEEAIGQLQTERALLKEKIDQTQNHVDTTLGPGQRETLSAIGKRGLEKIDKAIATLNEQMAGTPPALGTAPTVPNAAPLSGMTKTGVPWSIQ